MVIEIFLCHLPLPILSIIYYETIIISNYTFGYDFHIGLDVLLFLTIHSKHYCICWSLHLSIKTLFLLYSYDYTCFLSMSPNWFYLFFATSILSWDFFMVLLYEFVFSCIDVIEMYLHSKSFTRDRTRFSTAQSMDWHYIIILL